MPKDSKLINAKADDRIQDSSGGSESRVKGECTDKSLSAMESP